MASVHEAELDGALRFPRLITMNSVSAALGSAAFGGDLLV